MEGKEREKNASKVTIIAVVWESKFFAIENNIKESIL